MANVEGFSTLFFLLALLGGLARASPVVVSSGGHNDTITIPAFNTTSLPVNVSLWNSAISALSPPSLGFSTVNRQLTSVACLLSPHFRRMPRSPRSLTLNISDSQKRTSKFRELLSGTQPWTMRQSDPEWKELGEWSLFARDFFNTCKFECGLGFASCAEKIMARV